MYKDCRRRRRFRRRPTSSVDIFYEQRETETACIKSQKKCIVFLVFCFSVGDTLPDCVFVGLNRFVEMKWHAHVEERLVGIWMVVDTGRAIWIFCDLFVRARVGG